MTASVRAPASWWVYVIEADGKRLYTGISTDVGRRLREHLAGRGARALRGARQLVLLWQVELQSHGEALRVEYQIKALSARAKRSLIGNAPERDALLDLLEGRAD